MFSRLAAVPGGMTILALTATLGLDTSDQSAIGATSPEVRAALHIGQAQIGILATSSTIVGVLFTIPFGILADRVARIRLLKITVAIWTVAMLAVGASPNFGFMLVAHGVLGLVTGAGGPLIASVVGDLVPQERRGRVYSSLLLGELIGSAVGLAASGEVAALIGWRWAYWLLALLGVIVLTLLLQAVEPLRAGQDCARGHPTRVPREEISFRDAVLVLLRNRTNVVLVLASALGYYFFAGVQTFAVSLLTEAYGVSTAVAPALVLLVALSLAVGVVVGGPAGDRLLRKKLRSGRLPLVVIAFGGSLAFIVPALASPNVWVTMPLLVVGGVLLGGANPAIDATRIDIVSPRLLGRAEAIRTAVRDGADSSAPVIFGVLAAGIGLRDTFLFMTLSLVLALVLCAVSLRTYPRDIAAVPELVRDVDRDGPAAMSPVAPDG